MADGYARGGALAATERTAWRAGLLALLFGGVLAAVTFAVYAGRGEYGDEGSFCTIAQGILGGRLPYRDLFNEKPPLQYFWTAAVMALGGPTLAGARIASSIVLALTAGCIVLGPLRRKGAGLAAAGFMLATAAIAVRLEAYRNTADSTLALFYVLSAVLLARPSRGVGSAVAVGALQGLALGFRQTASASALVLLLSPGMTRVRVAFALGVLGGLLAWLAPLAASGVLMDFVRSALLFHVGNVGGLSYLKNHIDHVVSLVVWMLIVSAVGVASKGSRTERLWAIAWLFAAALAYVGRKEEFRLWPSAAAGLAMLAWEDGAVSIPAFAVPARAAVLLAVATVAAGVMAIAQIPPRHPLVEAAAAALRRVSGPQEEVWAGPFSPYIYCLAERRPASRYYFVLPWTNKAEVRQEILGDIARKRPIIVIDGSIPAFSIGQLAPEVSRIVAERYRVVVPASPTTGRYTIYRPNLPAADLTSAAP